MAEYIDITETGPLTGQQLRQQNTNNFGNFSRTYTPGEGPITGPIITPEQQQLIDKENKENSRVRYVAPKGTQLNNNYEISTEAERKKWWENEGRKKYGSRFGDASIKKGYFNDKELEGVYRDMLFNKEFSNLPEYEDLLKLSPDERDSFYAYWRGRVNAPLTYEYQGKKYPVPLALNPDNFAHNPEGREAGRVLADLNYYFGENFNDWSNEERKKFYDDWGVKDWNLYNNSFLEALEKYPELRPSKQFQSENERSNYYRTLYDKFIEAEKLSSTVQSLNPNTSTKKWSADTASIFNPAGLDSLAVASIASEPETTKVYLPTLADMEAVKEQNKLDEIANEESRARIKEYEAEYLKQHWYDTETYKQAQEKAGYWTSRNQGRRGKSYLKPSNKLLKEAHEYALSKEEDYQISQLPEKAKQDALNKKALIAKYKEEYIRTSDETPFPLNLGLNFAWRINGNEDSFPFKFDFPFSKEKAAEKYAEEKYAREYVKTDKVEPEQNIYASGISRSQIKQAVQNFSNVYQKFNGSDWMPENEIPYDKIYDKTKSLWESGNWREAVYQTDKIIENSVIDPHQSFFNGDNLGNMSSGRAALTQFYTMGVESLVESASAIPSLVVGAVQAFDPDDLQEDGYMNYFDRMLDNALHNDWLGVLSNQNVSDWAAQASEDAIIYGEDFNSLVASGAGTAGAQIGNLLMFAAGGLEAKAARTLMRNAATAAKRGVLRNIVNEGNLAKRQLQLNKAVSNSNLFRANYGEAAQQALEGERQIYETYNEKKWELIDSYTPKDLPKLVRQEGDKEVYTSDYEFSYTREEYEEALKHDANIEAWTLYEQGIGPHPDEDEYEFKKRVSLRAQGIHIFNEKHPNYDEAVELNARRKSAVDLGTQTAELLAFDKLFGGIDKWTVDFAMGRKALNPKQMLSKIKGTDFGNLKVYKDLGKTALSVGKVPITEMTTEVGQQTGSALTKQYAEHNIDTFLENQLYGNGLASWAASSYEGIYNLDKEEFFRDADLKRTILQTLVTTPLMPVFGYTGKRTLRPRGQNQSWVSRAIDAIQYYSPINTQIGTELYNIRQGNREIQDFVDYINRWGADPVNQANTRGLIGVQNYTEKMVADLINNDEVAYNNDLFSRTLSEAIMLANTQGTGFSQNRLQWLTNMSQIKSATAEQKAAAVKSMREEATGNSAVRNLSDEELLDLMESSSKRVLDTYNKVNDIISSDERFTDGTYNWQQQSALIFNRMAREDLNTRVADKEIRIQAAIQSLGEIDLGESKTSKEKVEDNKVNNKKVLLSGRDILALSPMKRAAMLSPKNLKSYSPEQQKIIQETINALNQVDGNILKDIRNAGLEEHYLRQVEEDYKASLQTPGWESKRVKNKANNIEKAFSSEGNTQSFNTKLSQATSVQDIYNTILNEREANATRRDGSQINVEDVLNNIQNLDLKQKVEEARRIERVSNSIKSAIASTNLSDDVKDNLVQQVDKVSSESSTVNNLTDISNYNIPLTPDGRDLSGDINNILQTAAQNASNTQTVDSEPVENFERPTDDIPEPTDLGERGVDTAMPINEDPLRKYTLNEAEQKLKELNDALVAANSAETNFQHDTLLINASILKDDLEKKLPEGYELQPSTENNFFIYKIVKTLVKKATTTPTMEDKKDDITDIDSRKEEPKQPIDRDGITKVAEVQFREGGNVYSYPVRDEDVQLGDGVNNTVGSETGRVINIRDVQDDAEAEFLIYRTDENGNKVKRDRPQFIDRHSQSLTKTTSTESDFITADDITENSVEFYEVNMDMRSPGLYVLNQDYKTPSGIGLRDLRLEIVDLGLNDASNKIESKNHLVPLSSSFKNGYTFICRKDGDRGNPRVVAIKGRLTNEQIKIIAENFGEYVPTTFNSGVEYDVSRLPLTTEETNTYYNTLSALREFIKDVLNKSSQPESSVETPSITSTSSTTNNRYSNRTEYQQSIVDNNITPAVTELDGAALSKGLFEPNQHTGQPNIMRQLQEEGAFDYMNKGALNEGDEIEFVVSQEQMPDGSYQVVIWEVTEPKDGEERNNPKWYGRQLLNVLDQTEVEGRRAELINRIRKAYEEAGRPESFLYPNEKFIVNNISHGILPFKQTNPTEASSEETIESTNLQKGLTKQNGVWGVSFFNKAKGKMVHVPIMFRQAKRDRSGAAKILLSDPRLKSKTIEIQKTNIGQTGDITDVTMVLPTPKGFVSAMSVYVLTKNIPNSSDKYKESVRTGSVGKALISKIKAHLNDIKTVSAFSDYLGFRRGFSEYIYNDRTYGRIDLGYRGSTGNNVLVSAIPSNGKYILVDPTDARNILNDNNGQGFTLDEVCKEYLSQLIDSPEADVTMRLNMEAIENNPSIITDLIDDGLLWAPNSLNARFTAANTQFNSPLDNEAKAESNKEVKQEPQQPKETPKPAPVVSNTNPSTTTTEVKKTKPKVDDTVELGSKVKRRKLKASQSNQTRQEAPTTPTQESVTNPTVVSNPSSFETLSEKDKQHVLSKVTKEEWDNLTREEQNNILNC